MHLVEALIEAATGNNWHNCSWNGRTGRFCQENGPSTCATYSGDRTSEVYFAGRGEEEGSANFEGLGGTCCTCKLCLCFVNLILVNVMIKGAFANKRGRRVPQTLKDSAACVANVAS